MKNINILVFPCGSEIGQEIFRSLKNIRYISLFGGSSVDDHGKWLYKQYTGNLPYITDAHFIEQINDYVDRNHIDFIFPAMDSAIFVLSEHRKELHAKLLTSPSEAVKICRSKSDTYLKLADCDFLPIVFHSPQTITSFPVFVKPAIGQGSQGVKLVQSQKELANLLASRNTEQVICEYLPGEEYTVDCFTDRYGNLRYANPRVRGRIRNGISVNSYTIGFDADIQKIASTINTKIVFRGAWFFQVKRDSHGKLKLLECATRIAGTMCVERALGVNLPLLTIIDALDIDVSITPQAQHIIVDRALYNVFHIDIYYDELYIDFDDTLIIHDHINMEALALIYQCIERSIPVTLITRHNGDIYTDLHKAHIDSGLFAAIIKIANEEKKSAYIKPSKYALFIDDSYMEREDVSSIHHIPSLGIESIEALIDHHA